MPSRDGAVRIKEQAIVRINEAARNLTGGTAPEFEAPRLHKTKRWLQETVAYEAFAAWLESLDSLDVSANVAPSIPLEYLTMEGLRWQADQRGLATDEVSRKTDLIDLLKGE